MSENYQNEVVQNMINKGKAEPQNLVQNEIEEAIEMLHGDLRSISRQIKQRKMRCDMNGEFGKQSTEEVTKLNEWLNSVEKVANNKFDQIRILERVLGEIRSGNVSDITKAHFHVRILKEIALKVDDSIISMKEKGLNTFLKEDVEELSVQIDDLYSVWKELFEAP